MTAFDGMEAFVAVVEARSFTAAARRLGLSKSFVSELVKGLENRLGVRLLDRTTRSLNPTEAGRAFYTRAARAVAEAEAARTEAQQHQAEPVGRLRVAIFDGFHRLGLLTSLPAFLDAHPSLEIDFVEGVESINLVEKGFDLAIRITPDPDPGLIVRKLGVSRVGVVAAASYLARAGIPAHPADLAGHRVVAFSPLFYSREWRFTVQGKTVVYPAHPSVLVNVSETLRAAAEAGLGVAALPLWMVSDLLASGELIQVLPGYPLPHSGLYAVYASNRLMTPKVKLFVDHIVTYLPPNVLTA